MGMDAHVRLGEQENGQISPATPEGGVERAGTIDVPAV